MTCECIEKVNKFLGEQGLALSTICLMNMETGSVRESVYIATERLTRGVRTKKKKMTPNFCPFCGEWAKPGPKPEPFK